MKESVIKDMFYDLRGGSEVIKTLPKARKKTTSICDIAERLNNLLNPEQLKLHDIFLV